MKTVYFIIHPGENPPPQNGCQLKSVFFSKHRFHILHFPNSTGLFRKPTGRHYTKYWFSPDIVTTLLHSQDQLLHSPICFIPIHCDNVTCSTQKASGKMDEHIHPDNIMNHSLSFFLSLTSTNDSRLSPALEPKQQFKIALA
jgi:hypothetical protein